MHVTDLVPLLNDAHESELVPQVVQVVSVRLGGRPAVQRHQVSQAVAAAGAAGAHQARRVGPLLVHAALAWGRLGAPVLLLLPLVLLCLLPSGHHPVGAAQRVAALLFLLLHAGRLALGHGGRVVVVVVWVVV